MTGPPLGTHGECEVQIDSSTLEQVFNMFGCDVFDFDLCGVQRRVSCAHNGSCGKRGGGCDHVAVSDPETAVCLVLVNRILGRIWKDHGLIIPFDEEVVKYMEMTDRNLRHVDCFEIAEGRLCKFSGYAMSWTVPAALQDRYQDGVDEIIERYRRYYSERMQAYYESLYRQEDVDAMLEEYRIQDRRHLNALCKFTSMVQAV